MKKKSFLVNVSIASAAILGAQSALAENSLNESKEVNSKQNLEITSDKTLKPSGLLMLRSNVSKENVKLAAHRSHSSHGSHSSHSSGY